jgi:diguanylate cyclase (GGDEF)-like protein/PAS domain S-box-containing protein
MEPPKRSSLFGRSMAISILALIAVVTLGTNTQLFAPPLLALLLTAAVAALLVSMRRASADSRSPGVAREFADRVSAEAGVVGESLFLETPIPSLLVDSEFQEIVAANSAVANLYGFALRDLRGLRISKLQPSSAGDSQGDDAVPVSGLVRHRRADGSSLWVELSVQKISHAGRAALLIAVVDVTARQQLVRGLEESERHYRELIDLSLGIVFTHDLKGALTLVNPAFARALDFPAEDIVGRNLSEFVVPRQHDAFSQYLLNVGRNGTDAGAVHMLRRDGGELVWEFRNQMRTLADGSREVLCCAVDISERSRNEHRLLEKSRKDPLTGCYNRRHLAAFQTDAKPGASWASVVIDIDHLKRYNDTYGHRAGDQAIVRLARFLERIVRKDDSIVRLGGDEFVILLQQCDPVTLESFAVRLQGALATQETVPFSYGLAMRKNDEELELTIHRADRQMIERRIIERSSIRLDVPREARRSEARRSVIRIHPEVGSVQAEPISTPSLEAEG